MRRTMMAVQENDDGRPCGWGLVTFEDDEQTIAAWRKAEKTAIAEAKRQYAMHACYPGEERGSLRLYVEVTTPSGEKAMHWERDVEEASCA